jgi:hypothetical protein
MKNENEIILYHSHHAVEVEVRLENETVWLTQAQIVSFSSLTSTSTALLG